MALSSPVGHKESTRPDAFKKNGGLLGEDGPMSGLGLDQVFVIVISVKNKQMTTYANFETGDHYEMALEWVKLAEHRCKSGWGPARGLFPALFRPGIC